MNEETLFKSRLSVDDRIIKRCIKRYQAFVKAIKSKKSKTEINLLYQQFENDLAQAELSLSASEMTMIALEHEEKVIKKDEDIIEKSTKEYEIAILKNEQILKLAKEERLKSKQYDHLKAELFSLKPYSKLIKETEILEKEKEAIDAERQTQQKCITIAKHRLNLMLDELVNFDNLVNDIGNNPLITLTKFNKENPDFDFEEARKKYDIEQGLDKMFLNLKGKINSKELSLDIDTTTQSKNLSVNGQKSKIIEKKGYRSKHSGNSSPRSKRSPVIEEGELISDTPPLKHHRLD
ncbi:hypothetical protein K502DRAFT_331008 [Neoconidiobolus thromboides FSU 785]|nr:hypothetical protein K502DRAFT_331008 [Neoconidiobolus thromboides FSU 785]